MARRIGVVASIVLVLYVAAIFVPFEPLEWRPGASLGGSLAEQQEVSWDGRRQVYLETRTWYLIPHSVTVMAWVRGGTIYVSCSSCYRKRWAKHVAADPNVRLQVDGKLFERSAAEVTDPEEFVWAFDRLDRDGLPDDLVLYRMDL